MTEKKVESNKYSDNGTVNTLNYNGMKMEWKNLITNEIFPLTASDTLLYQINYDTGKDTTDITNAKFLYSYVPNHKIKKECPKCGRPIREHIMQGSTSVLICVCSLIESTG